MGWVVGLLSVLLVLLAFMCVEDAGKNDKASWPNYIVSLIGMIGLLLIWIIYK